MEFKLFKRRKASPQPSVYFLPDKQPIAIRGNESLLRLAKRAGVKINHSCDGNATCGTCRVNIHEGLEGLPQRGELEEEWALDRDAKPQERLACQIPAIDGLVVEVPPSREDR